MDSSIFYKKNISKENMYCSAASCQWPSFLFLLLVAHKKGYCHGLDLPIKLFKNLQCRELCERKREKVFIWGLHILVHSSKRDISQFNAQWHCCCDESQDRELACTHALLPSLTPLSPSDSLCKLLTNYFHPSCYDDFKHHLLYWPLIPIHESRSFEPRPSDGNLSNSIISLEHVLQLIVMQFLLLCFGMQIFRLWFMVLSTSEGGLLFVMEPSGYHSFASWPHYFAETPSNCPVEWWQHLWKGANGSLKMILYTPAFLCTVPSVCRSQLWQEEIFWNTTHKTKSYPGLTTMDLMIYHKSWTGGAKATMQLCASGPLTCQLVTPCVWQLPDTLSKQLAWWQVQFRRGVWAVHDGELARLGVKGGGTWWYPCTTRSYTLSLPQNAPRTIWINISKIACVFPRRPIDGQVKGGK